MSKEDKKKPVEGKEDFILKKIRHYQGNIKDYETFWNQKIAEGEREESPETKACQKHNVELNKAFEIIPVEDDPKPETIDPEKSDIAEKSELEAPLEGEKGGGNVLKKVKKEKKEEKHEEEEEVKVEDAKKEEKGEDDGEKKKKKKEDKD